ncbi:MAG: histidine kinase N-terminal domain-containing protein [Mycobacteriales bacterium]|nr:histidine kinase N-terminal domain-containing protein [Mycobacteriales bacterium]
MSTLADLVRARTDLGPADVDRLHRLVGEWQLVADLSFADLVLWCRTREGGWLAVAHMRPTTGPTAYPDDVVGSELATPDRVERAWRDGRIVREGEPEWRHKVPVRQEAVPVRDGDRTIAVLSRDTNLASARMPSQLELTYLTAAGELLQMVSEGSFPFSHAPDPEGSPRVGDGFLRLDRTGHVVYASPNALSASRRLGVTGDLIGAHLGHTISRLSAGPGLDEPRGSAAVAAVLRFREPRESEVEGRGTTVLLRALPLVPGGELRGAVVLLRDVTEVRRRDRQIMGKDATIREIHHRVKNNLQTVAALLRLQARRMTDPAARAALEESVRRVASIAVVHETLSRALDESVAFDGIADTVLAMCAEVAAPESQVRVVRRGSFGVLTAEVATPLSMVLTELVQNAVEHAFAGRAGVVEVLVTRVPGRLEVVVADDGTGLPEGFDLLGSPRLGLQIVRTLVDGELRGTLELVPGEVGTQARLVVPLVEPAPD